ncbi:P27 family phage terminase small subunit [Bremerella cremea]|uniref:P27 family phage terminase small subunit n=1 Tax=Bremerella cremea TaxID=1031537 RepID=UPI0031EBE024
MAKRGRKPKPTALKIFEGNPGKRALPTDEPTPPAGKVEPPFKLDRIGMKVWRLMLDNAPKDLVKPFDALALWQFCQAWSDFFVGEKKVSELKGEYFVYSEKGGVYLHPAVTLRNQAWSRIHKLGPLFGWSPASRVGLNFNEGKKSPAEQLAEILMGSGKSGSG